MIVRLVAEDGVVLLLLLAAVFLYSHVLRLRLRADADGGESAGNVPRNFRVVGSVLVAYIVVVGALHQLGMLSTLVLALALLPAAIALIAGLAKLHQIMT